MTELSKFIIFKLTIPMKAQWILLLGSIFCLAFADPADDALRISERNLRSEFIKKLDSERALCEQGHRDNCQNALLSSVELNNIDSKIALRKLRSTVRESALQESIAEAIDKVVNVENAVSEIKNKLDK